MSGKSWLALFGDDPPSASGCLNTAKRSVREGRYSVFLSGNGSLVKILQEALARDKVAREKASGRTIKKGAARSESNCLFKLLVKHFDGWVLFFRIILFVIAAVLLYIGWENLRN